MRKVQVILFNDGNVDRNNRLQRLFNYQNVFVVMKWPESKGNIDFTPVQFGVKSFPAFVFLTETQPDYYYPQSVIQRDMTNQEIQNEYNRVANLDKLVSKPKEGQGGEGKKEGTGTDDGGNGAGAGGPGCLIPTWLTGGKCITLPAWIWLIPAGYATLKTIDAQRTTGRIVWGSAIGYTLYRYIKDLNRK